MHNLPAKRDLLIQSRFRNAILFDLMAGRTAAEVAGLAGVDDGEFGKFLNLKKNPLDKRSGEFRPDILKIAAYFRMLPEDLFPAALYELGLPTIVSHTLSSEEVLPMLAAKNQLSLDSPDRKLQELERHEQIAKALHLLTDRERQLIELRFGLTGQEEPKTLSEIGEVFGVTTERVRQIEIRALKRLRKRAIITDSLKYV